jgi:hypothetical protein
VQIYVAENLTDLREFAEGDALDLAVAAPDHSRRYLSGITFTEEEWATPAWAWHVIARVRYSYADESGNAFDEFVDFYTDYYELTGEDEPTFYLLTDATRQRHAERRDAQKDLFDPKVIERLRSQRLRAEREAHKKQEAAPKPRKASTKKAPAKKR